MATDRDIYIATASTRMAKQWHNDHTTWLELLDRCMTEYHTNETLAEYKAMPKDQQSNIKDIGGFVGGYLKDGKRAKGQCEFRDVLTLDVDHAASDFWDAFTMGFDTASFVYSTHTHTEKSPRLRLVVLLNRQTTAEEYEAVARYMAGAIGIEQFDHTTYQPERLMYWPSTPRDQQPIQEYQDGPMLDVDAILNSYHNWHDASEWPYSNREVQYVKRDMGKKGNPTEAKGIVGAFCRVYDVPAAIDKFLSDAYTEAGQGRYTYNYGTVSAGFVLYQDGQFGYANNDTDPCSQKLVNAFDLVMYHKFAELDANTDSKTPISRRPSYRAMEEFANADKDVKMEMLRTKLEEARGEDWPVEATQADTDDTWKEKLMTDKNGSLKNTVTNAVLILLNDPATKGYIAGNEWSKRIEVVGKLPWRGKGLWLDKDNAELVMHLEKFGLKGKEVSQYALKITASRNKFHPIRNYLNSLTWDGTKRIGSLFIDFLGADDTPLTRKQTELQFKACVARVLNPGCKYDNCLVLSGPQGLGKSTLLRKMAGEWFNDSFYTFENKDAMEGVVGTWIIELPEMTALTNAKNAEVAKAFLSKQNDDFRAAYAITKEVTPRECVFFGTTNDNKFLSGLNGNRRFWPISVGVMPASKSVFDDFTPELRDQLWAESVANYKEDKSLFLTPEFEAQAREIQDKFNLLHGDERVNEIAAYLDILLPGDWDTMNKERRRAYIKGYDPIQAQGILRRDTVSVPEILWECFGVEGKPDKMSYFSTKTIAYLMKQVPGWEYTGRQIRTKYYGRVRLYRRTKQEVEEIL